MESEAQPSGTLNPWTAMWWKPQAAIDAVVNREGRSPTLVLAALMGVATVIGAVALVPDLHWLAVIAVAILVGPLAGLIALYVDGLILSWVGGALGGRASQSTLRTAIAWSALPSIAALLIVLGAIAVFGQEFLRAFAAPDSVDDPVLFFVALLAGLLPLWAIFLKIRTVGAVQRFGVIRATATVAASLLVMLAVAVGARTFLFQPFSISSSSMEPALHVGEHVYADKRSYGVSRHSFPFDAGFEGRLGTAAPSRGDIVVFKLGSDPKLDYIKRVIGLPGDEILMQRGVLHINGSPVPKLRVGDVTVQNGDGSTQTVPAFEETLPEGRKIIVLDTEQDGPFDNVGPFRVAPGHYFMMGDNRDNAMDSRSMEQVGLIPADNIFARVSIVYFSAGELRDTMSPAQAFENIRWNRLLAVPK